MTTLRSDVLVLGSTLGGQVAATYLARAGLRVILVEEDVHAKRPPLLREPFLLSGLHPGGYIHRVLREIGLPLIDQRELRIERIALQLILADARIDLYPDDLDLARELEAFGLAPASESLEWLGRLGEVAERARGLLWEDAARGRSRRLDPYLPPRLTAPARVRASLPKGPPLLLDLATALSTALVTGATGTGFAGLLVAAARQAVFRAPHVGHPFLDLFRRRLQSLHVELRSLGPFTLTGDRNEVGIELSRGRIFARALVIAVPREPLRRFCEESGPCPRWLRPGAAPFHLPQRVFRAETASIPVGMGTRVVVADGDAQDVCCISRHPDPGSDRIEWLVLSGPGAQKADDANPLGGLAPFPGDGIIAADPGPSPRWDLDAASLGQAGPEQPALARNRPPIVNVGPELGPGLGFEGEVLQARRVALRLAQRLGARRGTL